jgi:muramidase (phage lysozyme)
MATPFSPFKNLPEQRRLLDAIAAGESAYGKGDGYDVMYGGGRFNSFADHPRQAFPIRSGPNVGKTTSAAGRYQFLGSTWDSVAKEAGLRDFSKESQDTGAWHLAAKTYGAKTGRDLLADLQSGNTADVAPALKGVWTSIPGGIEPNKASGGFNARLSDATAQQQPTNQGALSMPQPQQVMPAARQLAGRPALSPDNIMGQGALGGGAAPDMWNGIQNAGAWLMAISEPKALGALGALKPETDNYSVIQGNDGRLYRYSKKTGGVEAVGMGDGTTTRPVTPGQKKVDEDFAKDFNEWTTGGYATSVKGLEAVNASLKALREEKDLTGPLVGLQPEAVLSVTNPRALAVKQDLASAIGNTLRATLGPQFTQKEGEDIIARAYDPRLPQEENIKRVERLQKQLERHVKAKQSAAEHFHSRGSLVGWNDILPKAGSIILDEEGKATAAPAAPAAAAPGAGFKVLKVH